MEYREGQGKAAAGPQRETGYQGAQGQKPCPTYGYMALAFCVPFPSLMFLVCKMQILTFASGGDAAMKLNEMKHKKVPSAALGTNHEFRFRKMLFPVACPRIHHTLSPDRSVRHPSSEPMKGSKCDSRKQHVGEGAR